MSTFKLTLLDNAYHSIGRSLKHARDASTDNKEWKFGILLLIQAMELIFKEALHREHPVLIYEKIDQRNHTVSISSALRRLQEIVRVEFSQSDLSSIKTAIQWRNQLMHYECELNIIHAQKVYYKLFVFLREFHKDIFKEELADHIETNLWEEIIDIEEFLSSSIVVIEEKIKNKSIDKEWVWECRRCEQPTFIVQDEENICYLCGYIDEVSACEDCGKVDYQDTMHSCYIGNGKRLHAWKLVCSTCYEEITKRFYYDEEDEYYGFLPYR